MCKKTKLQNKARKNKEINADEEAEEGEPLFNIGENINLCTQYEKITMEVSLRNRISI